jgi:hypothetical protein
MIMEVARLGVRVTNAESNTSVSHLESRFKGKIFVQHNMSQQIMHQDCFIQNNSSRCFLGRCAPLCPSLSASIVYVTLPALKLRALRIKSWSSLNPRMGLCLGAGPDGIPEYPNISHNPPPTFHISRSSSGRVSSLDSLTTIPAKMYGRCTV